MWFYSKIPFGKRIGIPDKINTKDTTAPSFEFRQVKPNSGGIKFADRLTPPAQGWMGVWWKSRKTGLRCFWSGGGVIFYNEFFTIIPVCIYL